MDVLCSSTSSRQASHGPVVIVEDDEALRAAITFSLEVEGFEVAAFESAEQVLERMPFPSACLVIDYVLPGSNGLALLTRLRSLGVKTPALLVTTHPNSLVRARAALANAQILEKPLGGDEILRAVKSASGRQ